MFGRRCTLCGGKLDGRGICQECGLDNTKSDKYYRINHSDCDNMPMTHVHEDKKETYEHTDWSRPAKPKKEHGKKKTVRKSVNYNTMDKKKKKPGCFIFVFIAVIALAELLPMIGDSDDLRYEWKSKFENLFEDSDYGYEERDPYEYLETELTGEGESVTYTLPSGRYVAGIHIPAGYYTADVKDPFDVVHVMDMENGIYLYEYSGKEERNYLDDLRIFPGAVVEIEAVSTITLHSEYALTQEMNGIENPLTEEYEIQEVEVKKTAGVDFEPGVYDIEWLTGSGTGTVEISILDENKEILTQSSIALEEGRSIYKNMVLPEHAEITMFGDLEVVLRPSETIESTDYMKSYLY